jgi:hypothetical protein
MKSNTASQSARMRVARQENLTFPEPFYWTTSGIEQLRSADPDFRRHTFARAIDALNSPPDKVRLAAEGDSWFDHPCLQEIIDWIETRDFAVYRSDKHGRLLTTMVEEKVYLRFLDDTTVRAMLLSGGGNDLISWKRESNDVPSPIFKRGNGSKNPMDYLNQSEIDAALAEIARLLGEFARDVLNKRPKLPIITHCYDWFEPKTWGKYGAWIGPQMDMVGVDRKGPLRRQIATLLINRANEAYSRTCSSSGMIYVDLRGTTSGRWDDEIHPNEEAFSDIATKLISAIPGGKVTGRKRAHYRKSPLIAGKGRRR